MGKIISIIRDDFHKTIIEWLTPFGFVEVYKNNPNEKYCECHFMKDNIMIECKEAEKSFCYLHTDILYNSIALIYLSTTSYPIGFPEIKEVHNYLLVKSKLLQQ